MNLEILHIGSKYHGDNDIVSHFASSLSKKVKTHCYWIPPSADFLYRFFWKRLEGPFHFWRPNYISLRKIDEMIMQASTNINCIILNSNGFFISKKTLSKLNAKGVKVVTISLSDPDVYKSQTQFQIRATNLHFTNSILISNKYKKKKNKVKNILFGVTKNKIRNNVNLNARPYDVIVVGESRPERDKVINELAISHAQLKIGCYGRGWDDKFSCGYVVGQELECALNSGRVYISFSTTLCGYKNIKVGMFEAMSAGCCVVSDNLSVLPDDLVNGEELFSVSSEDEIVNAIGNISHQDIERVSRNATSKLNSKFVWEETINSFITTVESDLF